MVQNMFPHHCDMMSPAHTLKPLQPFSLKHSPGEGCATLDSVVSVLLLSIQIVSSLCAFFFHLLSFFHPEQLIALIAAAKQHDVEFIYAVSPGLDITFSNPREVAALKRKLDQVGLFMWNWKVVHRRSFNICCVELCGLEQ